MSDFVAGFAARHDAAVQVLARALAPTTGFAPTDLFGGAARGPVSFAPQGQEPEMPAPVPADQAVQPKHFSPADHDADPTEGWDPLDPGAPPTDFIDPLVAAHAAGFAEGLAAAAAAAREAGDRDNGLCSRLAAELTAGARFDRERMAEQLRQTVLMLVTKLVGEVGIAPDVLAKRVEAASELLTDSAESALLRVHPDDVALLDGRLPKTVFAAGDPGVARGSFVLESASTVVEDGPELWLEQLAHAIERVPVPAAC